MTGNVIDWASIDKKVGVATKSGLNGGVLKKSGTELASEFIGILKDEIMASSVLTAAEKERVLSVGITSNVVSDANAGTMEIEINFSGDKTMVSISPTKSVYNLVALFNNGYPTNNVDPAHPPRGKWHGKDITIYPKAKTGAMFISNAIEKFKSRIIAGGGDIVVSVDPAYNI